MPHPETLPITAFERYQYWETRTGHPNQIAAVFDFHGQIRTDVFTEAVNQVRRRHPLFSATMHLSGQSPTRWKLNPEDRVPVVFLPSSQALDFDNLPLLPPIHPAETPAGRLTVRYDSKDRCQWILQTHHSHCDGVGGLQIIRELMQVYHSRCSESELDLRPLPIERLIARDKWRGEWSQLWKKPLQLLGLFGASKFLLRKIVDLSQAKSADNPGGTSSKSECSGLQTEESASESTSESASESDDQAKPEIPASEAVEFSHVDHQLTVSQTKRLRQLAKQSGVTVNSLLLAHWMVALHQWNVKHRDCTDRDWYRLVIPTNERNLSDLNLSACNRVSLVYVDRQVREFEYPEALMQGIHYEMSVMRNLNLTRTMLLALRIMNWIPGVLRHHARSEKCWATSYVTNLGGVFDRLNTPLNADRQSVVGDLTMQRIRLLPPLRPGTPIALAVNIYARRIGFTVHVDSKYLSRTDAQQILRYFLNRILTIS